MVDGKIQTDKQLQGSKMEDVVRLYRGNCNESTERSNPAYSIMEGFRRRLNGRMSKSYLMEKKKRKYAPGRRIKGTMKEFWHMQVSIVSLVWREYKLSLGKCKMWGWRDRQRPVYKGPYLSLLWRWWRAIQRVKLWSDTNHIYILLKSHLEKCVERWNRRNRPDRSVF